MTVASPDLKEATGLHYRACTLCEAMCGLEIQHVDGAVLSIRGDEHNHFSRGHICPKGNALQDVHVDPERIRFPLRRSASGWERVGWDEALPTSPRGCSPSSATTVATRRASTSATRPSITSARCS